MSRNVEFSEFIEDVRAANPLRELMSENGKFDKQGFISCPFHNEKTPSCHLIGEQEDGFYCFGCSAGGDVFAYIQKRERVDFRRAIDFLADRVGKSWASSGQESDPETQALLDGMIERRKVESMLTEGAHFFHNALPSKVRAWVRKQYGFDDDTINRKVIGYGSGESLLHWFKEEQGYTDERILHTGLFVRTGRGLEGFFDGRVTFPYMIRGRAKYMIGRKTEWTGEEDWEKGKYKKLLTGDKHDYVSKTISNSWFFGEDDTRGNVDLLCVTEGVTDCLSIQMVGLKCISPVTTRFSHKDLPRLLELVKGIKKVIICNDNDTNSKGGTPGLDGAVATVGYLFEHGIDARLAQLPRPKGADKIDNNEFIRTAMLEAVELGDTDPKKFARERLLKIYGEAKSYPQYKIDSVPTGLDPTELAIQLKAIFKIVATCGPVERDGYVTAIARRFGISKTAAAGSVSELLPEAERRDAEPAPGVSADGKGKGSSGGDEVIRGQIVEDVEHYYVRGKKWDEVISTFVLSPKRLIRFEEEYLIECAVRAKGLKNDVMLQLPRKSFESKREFIRAFRNPAMQWTGSDDNVQSLLSTLKSTDLIERKGVKTLGYYKGKDGPIWITDSQVFDANGPVEDPEVIYIDRGAPLATRLSYEFPDADEVKKLAAHALPRFLQINVGRVMVPAIGWWFASLLKAPIAERLGHFPLLFVYGSGGSGKTSIVQQLWRISGASKGAELFSCTDTMFAIARNSSTTMSVAIPFDEFRADMGKQKIEQIQRFARRVYNGDVEMRGRQDQGVNQFSLQAPSCFIGENRPESDPALIERLILVNPDKFALTPERSIAFNELMNSDHGRLAGSYVQFALRQDVDALLAKCRRHTDELIERMKRTHVLPHRCYDNMLVVVLGLELFESFALEQGVDLPAFDYVDVFNAMLDESLEGSNGTVKDSFDHLLEEASVLAHLGLLTEGREYTLHDGKINLFLPAVYKRYVDERRKSGKEDATNGLRALKKVALEKLGGGSGYLTAIDKRVTFPDGGQRRCMIVDPKLVPETLDFEMFPANASEAQERRSAWGGGSSWERESSYKQN